MAKVVLQKLTKKFADKHGAGTTVVAGIDLVVESGEFMVLVGPSGCGKSTTLRMIAGLEKISSGAVFIGDRCVNDVAPKDRDIAMVFQNYALYPHMTVFENMAFGLKLRGFSKAETESRVRDAAAMLGLENYLDRKPKALSGGQRQRVAVGRALVRKPEVFLFDEPLSNLDAKMRVATRAEISKLHARLDSTMIYVTHDQVEAMTMGDRICVMKDGQIMQVAEPLNLYNEPANLFVAGFIGSPAINLIRGMIVSKGGNRLWFREASSGPETAIEFSLDDARSQKAAPYLDKPIVVGVRPDAVSVEKDDVDGFGKIDLVEPMGSETYVYFSTRSHTLTARTAPGIQVAREDRIRPVIDGKRANLFDPATERAL